MYKIQLTPSAAKQLRKLPGAIQRRIAKAVDDLRERPRPVGVKKLRGKGKLFRIRVGDYRVVYDVRDKVLTIVVVRIASRQKIYKRR